MAKVQYTVPIVIIVLIVLFIVYVIMVYPEERIRIFQQKQHSLPNTIYIKLGGFVPEEITIKKGVTVTWVNEDTKRHRIVGADFKSQIMPPGGEYKHLFNETGIFMYSSEFNPGMVGKIIVK